MIQISTSLIRKILIKVGLRAKIAAQKPLISDKNRQKRVAWCREKLQGENWETVVFSDETLIQMHSNGRVLVRRPEGKKFDPKYLQNTVKMGKKLMLWGFIKKDGTRGLFRVEKSINSDEYIKILEKNLFNSIYLGERLQQDNAPAHNSEKTWTFFNESGLNVLENWPPQSPDLNIIENIWSILKRKVMARNPKTIENLWQFSYEEFHRIPNEKIERLYDSIPRRLRAVIISKGGPTKY